MVASKYPNRPVLGFWRDLQSAAADYAAVLPQTPELLAAHRAGAEEARKALVLGFRWLCYQASRNPRWDADNTEGLGWRSELWGPLGEIFGNAVDRLRSGEKKAKTLTDVDAYIRSELRRARGVYAREITQNLLVPKSTKSTLKRNHQPEATLRRPSYLDTTQDSLPVAGQALPDGLSTRRTPLKGFRVSTTSHPPFSSFLTQSAQPAPIRQR